MPIEMPQGLPFSVDTWSPSSKKKRHHFLTHAHRDHTTGIVPHFSFPIYSTFLTKSIVLQQFPQVSLHFQSTHCFSFSGGLIWLGIVVPFRSYMIHCLYVSRWGNRWSSKILMELSPLPFSMLITALVFFPSHPFVLIKWFNRFY